MRRFLKKTTPIIIIFLVSASIFFGYNSAAGHFRLFASKYFRENFDTKISIGRLGIGLPLHLDLRDVKINDSIDIGDVAIYLSLPYFLLKKNFFVSEIRLTNPVLRIEKGVFVRFGIPIFSKTSKERLSSKTRVSSFYFPKIRIHNGIVIYKDSSKDRIELVKIEGVFENPLSRPLKDNKFKFNIEGFLKNTDSDFLSPFMIDGSMKPEDRIEAKLRTKDIMLNTLRFLYPRELAKSVKDGKVNIESNIQISKTDLFANCFLEIRGILKDKYPGQKPAVPLLANFILSFNFKDRILKVKNLRGNFFKLILNRS